VERAERVVQELMKMETDDPSIYVLMANIYAAAGRFEDSDRYRIYLRGLRKTPGLTWCEFDGKMYKFVAHDDLEHVPEHKEQITKKVPLTKLTLFTFIA